MFTPGIEQIADDLETMPQTVVGATTGFVVFLGIGPLILAPLSETFGRRRLYTIVSLPLKHPLFVRTALKFMATSASRYFLCYKYQRP